MSHNGLHTIPNGIEPSRISPKEERKLSTYTKEREPVSTVPDEEQNPKALESLYTIIFNSFGYRWKNQVDI
jgi:hypothetical protein